MTVILISRARRIKTFVLPHAIYCNAISSCRCTVVDARTRRRIPSSLTLVAGARSGELHEVVLQLPDVARAVASGELAVRRVPPKPKPNTARTERPLERRRARTKKGSR